MKREALVRIHQISYPALPLTGLAFYADRALLLPGITVVHAGEDIHEYRCFLAERGIGAELVLQVGNEDILNSVKAYPPYAEAIRTLVDAGAKIQFFNSTEAEADFLRELGLSWEDTVSALPDVSRIADNKAELRRLADTLGKSDAFPLHFFCKSEAEILRSVGEILESRPDFVVLKRADLASGIGTVKLRTDNRDILRAQVADYVAKYGRGKELIVEAGFFHTPYSILWDIHPPEYEVITASRQILSSRFEHEGNIIGSISSAPVSHDDEMEMELLTKPFVVAFRERGYRGICGFDCMKASNGRMYLLECNARITATYYAAAVAEQLPGNDWVLYMRNMFPTRVRSFAELHTLLINEGVLFDGEVGVLPFNVRCLKLPEPKCGLMCVAKSEEEASFLYRVACELTGART